MEVVELAERLTLADGSRRGALLESHAALADVQLARALKALCLDAWGRDPARVTGAAAALAALGEVVVEPEVGALAAWAGGYAAMIDGQMTRALAQLDEAEARFLSLAQPDTAAATQVLKLYALAMLGRYDEAIECGLKARAVLDEHGDALAVGKIEQNLGNIYRRRERYPEAERFLRAARARFLALNDQKQLAQIENSLAYLLSFQHKFRDAEQLYRQCLARAERDGLAITQAEIEASLGYLALFQGHYDRALDYLERARRRFDELKMPHKSAIAEQEMADAYLELNLAPEAAAIYGRVAQSFAELGMRADRARALAYHGRACQQLGRREEARALFAEAHTLYAAEGNAVGAALVILFEAQLYYTAGDYGSAKRAAEQTEETFAAAGLWGRLLLARWLRGEATRALGRKPEARKLLEAALDDAEQQAMPQVALRCHTSLGYLSAATYDLGAAEASFKRAVSLIEELRAPLPAEEFRTAFITDKLTPYAELVRLCLTEGGEGRVVEALGYVERARSRALLEMMNGSVAPTPKPRDPGDHKLLTRLGELREELNWYYGQINRPPDGVGERGFSMPSLHDAVREREAQVLEVMRQLQLRGEDSLVARVEPFDFDRLQRDLGTETALVEYTHLDGELLAFVVTDEGVEVFRRLGTEGQVKRALGQLHFQLGALRGGARHVRAHLTSLTARTRHHLRALYNILLRPIESRLGVRRLLVVPDRVLHYVPFHALDDGSGYVIERREVCYAPSAGVLRHCLDRPRRNIRRALLLGVPDGQTPHMRDEINTLAPLFTQSDVLLDRSATLAALREAAPAADLLHLACHGQFRPDNPPFSALRLSDGWLTMRDAYGLGLNCELVVLSACETGLSAVAPGNELIGLARGFFSAGAPSLMLSLWNVDDEATAALMTDLYTRLRAGETPAAALRGAQCAMLTEQEHPFFWSPFILVGRW